MRDAGRTGRLCANCGVFRTARKTGDRAICGICAREPRWHRLLFASGGTPRGYLTVQPAWRVRYPKGV